MTKDKRIDLRVTQRQKDMIEEAAAISGRTVTDFSVDTLTEEAVEVISRERSLQVDAEAFAAFSKMLDQPPQNIEGLADLLKRRTVFVD